MTVLELAWWWCERPKIRNKPPKCRSRAFKTIIRRLARL